MKHNKQEKKQMEETEIQAVSVSAEIVSNDNLFRDQSIASIVSEYEKGLLNEGEQTKRTYCAKVRNFLEYLWDNNIRTPRTEDIAAFRNKLEHEGHKTGKNLPPRPLKPATINLYLASIRSLFEWLKRTGRYENIMEGIKIVPVRKRYLEKGWFSENQERKIFNAAKITGEGKKAAISKRDLAILALIMSTGLRCISVRLANVGDISLDGNEYYLKYQGKGHHQKESLVKVGQGTYSIIQEYLKERGPLTPETPLFISESNNSKGQRISTNAISLICKTAQRSAGFDDPKWTAHSFRHSLAMNAITRGEKLDHIQMVLDHSSIATTAHYLHARDRKNNNVETRIDAALFS